MLCSDLTVSSSQWLAVLSNRKSTGKKSHKWLEKKSLNYLAAFWTPLESTDGYENHLLFSNTSEVLKMSGKKKVLEVSEPVDTIVGDVKMFNVASLYCSVHDIWENE